MLSDKVASFVGLKNGRVSADLPHPDFMLAFDPAYCGRQLGSSARRALKLYLAGEYLKGVSPHPLFDVDFYYSQAPELKNEGIEPLSHYLSTGFAAGLEPHPEFSGKRYYANYPDVRGTKVNPLLHYLLHGLGEHRAKFPVATGEPNYVASSCRLLLGRDPTSWEIENTVASGEPIRMLRHFLYTQEHETAFNQLVAIRDLPIGRYTGKPEAEDAAFLAACGIAGDGALEGGWRALIKRLCAAIGAPGSTEAEPAKKLCGLALWALSDEEPGAARQSALFAELLGYYLDQYQYFDEAWYRASGAIEADWRGSARDHYLQVGAWRGDAPNALFDPQYYRAGISRDIPAYRPDIVDYCTLGWLEGEAPSEHFSPAGYLRANIDVAAAFIEPLSHYIRFGRAEGRGGGLKLPNVARSAGPAVSGIPLLGRPYEKLIGLDYTFHPPSRKANPNRLRIDFVIPDFVPGAGGHMAIFKLIYWLEMKGHEVHIWIDYPAKRNDVEAIFADILRYFRPLKSHVHMLSERDEIETDVLVMTDRWTVWSGLRHFRAHGVFYFVQDLETEFHPAGSETILTEGSYQLGLYTICSSPWLAEKMRGYGSEVVDFIYPADPEIYYPSPIQGIPPRRAPRIAFYSRAATQRRAVELAVLGLCELHNRGADFVVAMFGQKFDDTIKWPFAVEYHQVLTERELGELFRDSDVGLVLSATNYSITAVEMMACGLPVVDIDTESTRATYPPETAILAAPTPAGVADALQSALGDPDGTRTRVENAARWIGAARWRDVADKVELVMQGELERVGGLGVPATLGRALKATVVIPTYNGGKKLADVLDATLAQAGPIEFDVLCIDSGSTDETLKVIAERAAVRLHQIPKSEFNHGETRNLGVELSDSEYTAFLTQDALPRSPNWLFDLVGVLDAVPSAAGAFGRHFAYPDASPFTKRDLDQHFDTFKGAASVVSKYTDPERVDEADERWLSFLRFFSNNNSCISRKAWRRVPFPTINFGEDQVWAWRALKAGYSKVYVDAAAVYHSHDYSADEERRRARTELAFYRIQFGVRFGVSTAQIVDDRTNLLNGSDLAYAMDAKIGWQALADRMKLNRARMEGYLLGHEDDRVVY